jgi:hypothetical protein
MTFDGDVASVFTDDLLTDGKTQAGAARSLGRLKNAEQTRKVLFGNTGAIVGDRDPDQIVCLIETRLNKNDSVVRSFDGVHRVGDDVQNRAVNPLGIEGTGAELIVGLIA